jgi:hypothetical protein
MEDRRIGKVGGQVPRNLLFVALLLLLGPARLFPFGLPLESSFSRRRTSYCR